MGLSRLAEHGRRGRGNTITKPPGGFHDSAFAGKDAAPPTEGPTISADDFFKNLSGPNASGNSAEDFLKSLEARNNRAAMLSPTTKGSEWRARNNEASGWFKKPVPPPPY